MDILQQYSILQQIANQQQDNERQRQAMMLQYMLRQKEQAAQAEQFKFNQKKWEEERFNTSMERAQKNRQYLMESAKAERDAAEEERKASEFQRKQAGEDAWREYLELPSQPEAEDQIIQEMGPAMSTPAGVTPLFGPGGSEERGSKFDQIASDFEKYRSQKQRKAFSLDPKMLPGIIGQEAASRHLGWGVKPDTSTYDINDALKSYKFDESASAWVSNNPFLTETFGLPTMVSNEDYKKLKPKPKTEQYQDAFFKIGSDPKAPIIAISNADSPEERRTALRRFGQFAENNPQLRESYPELFAEYEQIKTDDAKNGYVLKTITIPNADGTSDVEEWKFSLAGGKSEKVRSWKGSQALYTSQMRGRAAELLPEIQAGLTKVNTAWENLTPKGQSYWGRAQRYGESLWAKLQNANYNPSSDAEARAVFEFCRGQVALSIARIQTGAQRSDAEIARIEQAYLSGDLSFWEAKIQLKMLKTELLKQEDAAFNALQMRMPERFKDTVDFNKTEPGGALNRTSPAASQEDKMQNFIDSLNKGK